MLLCSLNARTIPLPHPVVNPFSAAPAVARERTTRQRDDGIAMEARGGRVSPRAAAAGDSRPPSLATTPCDRMDTRLPGKRAHLDCLQGKNGTFFLEFCRCGEGAAPSAPKRKTEASAKGGRRLLHRLKRARRTLARNKERADSPPRGSVAREGQGGCGPPHRNRGETPFPARTEPRPPRASRLGFSHLDELGSGVQTIQMHPR